MELLHKVPALPFKKMCAECVLFYLNMGNVKLWKQKEPKEGTLQYKSTIEGIYKVVLGAGLEPAQPKAEGF